MRLFLVNGSPHGRSGATAVMAAALLEGFRAAGGEAEDFALSELEVAACRGCHLCWTATPGRCAIQDDMGGLIEAMRGADFLAFATPVSFLNVSGPLKDFFDRLRAAGADPRNREAEAPRPPGILAIASAGHPGREQFALLSAWFRLAAGLFGGELLGEFYQGPGRLLLDPSGNEAGRGRLRRYLEHLRACGESLAGAGRLEEGLREKLALPLLDW